MKCPIDKNNLKETTLSGILVHNCQECHGTWFASDTLRHAKDTTNDDLRWLDFDLFAEKEGKFLKSAPTKENNCPRCSTPMKVLEYADSRVTIDVCPSGHGEWLDDKEFNKIIKYLEAVVVNKSASEYFKETTTEFKEVVTGKEGLVSEVKDFLAVTKLYQNRIGAENPEVMSTLTNIYTFFRI